MDQNTVILNRLLPDDTSGTINKYFQRYGKIVEVNVVLNYAFITFEHCSSADKALTHRDIIPSALGIDDKVFKSNKYHRTTRATR